MIDGFDKMLAGSLKLEEPWYIEGAEFDPENSEIHIHVGIRDRASFVCPVCGAATKRYGYETEERLWRHADCLFYPCYVHCRRPKVLCDKCGVVQVNAPFERKNSRFTLMFEGYAMLIMADVPRAKAARLLRCNEKSLVSILSYWVNDAVGKLDLSDVCSIAIDETAFKRGHKYVTVAIDADKRRVFDVEEGREKAAVVAVGAKLIKQGGDPDNITAVTSDMSSSFLPAVKQCFPNAEQIIDKFHVKQLLIKAMDDVRKQEQKSAGDKKKLYASRRLFMVPIGRMDDAQIEQVITLSQMYPKTGKAFRIVQSLDAFYAASNRDEGEELFDRIYSWMRRCRLGPMKEAAASLMRHKDLILNYFTSRLTNAICEGINSMIQAAKRKARGYHTFEGYASMIYLIAGKLKLAVPSPL